jgi:hypothetical protein
MVFFIDSVRVAGSGVGEPAGRESHLHRAASPFARSASVAAEALARMLGLPATAREAFWVPSDTRALALIAQDLPGEGYSCVPRATSRSEKPSLPHKHGAD